MLIAPKPVDKKPILRHKSEKKFDEDGFTGKEDPLSGLRDNRF